MTDQPRTYSADDIIPHVAPKHRGLILVCSRVTGGSYSNAAYFGGLLHSLYEDVGAPNFMVPGDWHTENPEHVNAIFKSAMRQPTIMVRPAAYTKELLGWQYTGHPSRRIVLEVSDNASVATVIRATDDIGGEGEPGWTVSLSPHMSDGKHHWRLVHPFPTRVLDSGYGVRRINAAVDRRVFDGD